MRSVATLIHTLSGTTLTLNAGYGDGKKKHQQRQIVGTHTAPTLVTRVGFSKTKRGSVYYPPLTLTHFDFSSCLYVCFVQRTKGPPHELRTSFVGARLGVGGRTSWSGEGGSLLFLAFQIFAADHHCPT